MSIRFDCPELGFYNMTDEEMITCLKEDAERGDSYSAACLRARGIDPARQEPHASSHTAQSDEQQGKAASTPSNV